MENILTRRNIIRATLVIGVFMLLYIAGYFAYNYFFFYAKSASPRNHTTVASSVSQAVITFNKDLDPTQDIYKDIVIEPQTRVYDNIAIDKNKLIINYNSLNIDTNYSVTFKQIKANNGKVINNFTYALKTKYVPYNRLSEQQQQKTMEGVDKGNADDPILSVIPYSTLDYQITPTYRTRDNGSAYLVVKIALRLTNADRNNQAAAAEVYKKQALDYLRSKGINPDSYTIEYTVNSSIAAPAP